MSWFLYTLASPRIESVDVELKARPPTIPANFENTEGSSCELVLLIRAMHKGQMRQAVNQVDTCAFWQKNKKFHFDVL